MCRFLAKAISACETAWQVALWLLHSITITEAI